jgi:hypothetical protein
MPFALHMPASDPKRTWHSRVLKRLQVLCCRPAALRHHFPLSVSVIYSALMPVVWITFAHFGISVWMRLENSSGVLSIVSKPSDASF